MIALAAEPNLDAIAREAMGRVGAAAQIVEGGTTIVSYHAREQFPMQSVYKLPIAMAAIDSKVALDRVVHVDPREYVRQGQHSPLRDAHPQGADVSVEELMRLAVMESDGSASDVVMRLNGGAPRVMDYLRSIGVSGMTVRNTEKEMGADWKVQYANSSSPEAAIAVLRVAMKNKLLLKWMTETTTSPGRIKGLLPAGTVVAHKTGSSGARDGVAAATNDIGIVTLPDGRHLAIAVFVADSKADEAARERVIAGMARAAWDSATKLHP
ncbi:MAG TPA: class A beta-lactamase [Bryobacteraceae bacterium]|nr:class A beta-lactamase [Bryobacteraceae bacterium]